MPCFNIIASTNEATVVTEYEPQQKRSDAYQSEAALESAFIKQLTEQGYTYLQIHNSDELVGNLRTQLEKLNDYTFSDDEWKRFFSQNLANDNNGIVEKTRLIQEDNVQVLRRDDGSSKNITLIDKKNVHNNSLQVINQYEENNGNFENRYDVTVLVNGFPLVHAVGGCSSGHAECFPSYASAYLYHQLDLCRRRSKDSPVPCRSRKLKNNYGHLLQVEVQ